MTPEERRMKRRERYKRKKEWQARMKKYIEFAEYMVSLKKIARENPTLTADEVIARHDEMRQQRDESR